MMSIKKKKQDKKQKKTLSKAVFYCAIQKENHYKDEIKWLFPNNSVHVPP